MKLERASKHLRDLQTACDEFMATDPYAYTRKVEGGPSDAEGPVHIFRWERFSHPPHELGLIVGDVVHNARSALDHLAVHLADVGARRVNTTLTAKEEKRIEFPITTSPEEFERQANQLGRLKHVDEAAIGAIRGLQPFNVSIHSDEAQFYLLSELDNRDKHRGIVAVGFAVSHARGAWPAEISGTQGQYGQPDADAAYGEPGSEILRFEFPSSYAIEDVFCEMRFGITLVGMPAPYADVCGVLATCLDTVRLYAEHIASVGPGVVLRPPVAAGQFGPHAKL